MESRTAQNLSVLELFQAAIQNSHGMKAVDSAIIQENDWFLFDLSLKQKGVQEDVKYSEDTLVRKNLRRGNTILVNLALVGRNDEVAKDRLYMYGKERYEIRSVDWARRGLYKFFDLCIEYAQHDRTANLDRIGSFESNFAH
jgi:hypothetical protein